jgi:hypothetical protein
MLYVLDGGAMTLAWRADKDADDGANATSIASPPAPSLDLRQRIRSHSGLPLRDVTAQAEYIAWGSTLSVATPRPPLVRNLISTPPAPKGEIRRRFRILGVTLAPFLLLMLVSFGAMVVQAPYYNHLYQQAHAHAALYRDALTHADGEWPVNDYIYFDNGVYHFQRSENDIYPTYTLAPRRYDHALVEVTGRTGGAFDLGGVGLTISGPDVTTPLLTFRATPDGKWWIERESKLGAYDPHSFYDIGDMSAIHQGFEVANQIAVLINGSDFTFYINGQYATGYHDDALNGAAVGLYLDNTSDSGDFSNFAVYPA